MSASQHPCLHRFAILTACTALGTVLVGALVTSKNAGMAFPDWPTSDGHGMLAYPWLASTGDKFLEHGHRLAGMAIGLVTIGLCAAITVWEPRRWVKVLGGSALVAVIVQGILGGFRVWLDERGLAMIHGAFAACVLALMASIAVVLSRNWHEAPQQFSRARPGSAPVLAGIVIALLALQYLLGGMIRHRGTGLHEHLGLGILALLSVLINAIVVSRGDVGWLRRSAWLLFAVVLFQAMLGAGAWVARFGFASLGYVAVAESIQQVVLRTAHMVVGILVFMAAIVHAVRVARVSHVSRQARTPLPLFAPQVDSLPAGGGVR